METNVEDTFVHVEDTFVQEDFVMKHCPLSCTWCHKNCAWWDKVYEKCTVVLIADSLEQMAVAFDYNDRCINVKGLG